MTEPSTPALFAIVLIGVSSALLTISTPAFWSAFAVLTLSRADAAFKRAKPPPVTMPSSTAARVALRASSTLSFLSLTSTSVAPPTLITATPPANLANLS